MKKTMIFFLLVVFLPLLAIESEPSEIVGFMKYECLNVEDGNYNLIAIPFECSYTKASELGADFPSLTSIRSWDSASQSWIASNNLGGTWIPDNPIELNSVYYVNVQQASNVIIAGKLGSSPTYNFIINENGNYNTAMLPIDSSLITASEWGNDIGSGTECTSIKSWNNTSQLWESSNNLGSFWLPDNEIIAGRPYYLNVNSNITWPESSKSNFLNDNNKMNIRSIR